MNISIRKEAYDFLNERRTKGKSFSDVIMEFKEKNSIMRFYGALKDSKIDILEKERRSFRDDFNKRFK